MVLKKRNSQYARWDHENNKWLVGNEQYQWYDEHTKEESPWMVFEDALQWIIEHDRNSNQNTEILLER